MFPTNWFEKTGFRSVKQKHIIQSFDYNIFGKPNEKRDNNSLENRYNFRSFFFLKKWSENMCVFPHKSYALQLVLVLCCVLFGINIVSIERWFASNADNTDSTESNESTDRRIYAKHSYLFIE